MQQKAAPGHALGQGGGLALIQQLPFVEQQHVAALLGFIKIGGTPEDQHPFARQLVHHLPQLAAGNRIHADAGFIQQQHFRFAHQGTGQAQLLLHPAGELARQPVGKGAEGGKLQQPGKGFLPRLTHHAAQIGIQGQVLHYGQIFVQAELLRHIAQRGVQSAIVVNGIETQHAGAARVGLEQSGKHAHQRGFTRPVGADQPGDVPALDGTGQGRDGGLLHAGKAFYQAIKLDRRVTHRAVHR